MSSACECIESIDGCREGRAATFENLDPLEYTGGRKESYEIQTFALLLAIHAFV